MTIKEQNGNTIIYDIRDFKLSQTLECGQCFHFSGINEEEYYISALNRLLHIKQEDNVLIFYDVSMAEVNSVWIKYFDLDRDYSAIKNRLMSMDDKLNPAINSMWGVRILNQDFFETLISFIISQNQQIPRIKQIVANISEACGTKLSDSMYAFPDAKSILAIGEEGVRACKAGFRSAYIIDACEKFEQGLLNEEELRGMSYDDCIATLKQIKGVGDKVANCVALFSLGHRSAFPVDVWIKRIMESIYFEEETHVSVIQDFANKHFGEYGGYAQQYLFYYARENSVKANEKQRKTEKNRRKTEKIPQK